MNAKHCGWQGWFLLVLLTGCLPTTNPLGTEQQSVFDSRVLGTWQLPNSQGRWEVTQRDDRSYRLILSDENGHTDRFVARAVEISGLRFLDLVPEENKSVFGFFYQFHLLPFHTVYRIRATTPKLELATIDGKWLDQYLADHPDAVPFITVQDRKLITADTEELQEFVVGHQANFNNVIQLTRAPDAS